MLAPAKFLGAFSRLRREALACPERSRRATVEILQELAILQFKDIIMARKKSIRLNLLHRVKLKRGMTLIELLISLFIIALMTGVAMPLFSVYQRRNILDNDVQSVAQMFAYARALQNNPDIFTRLNASGLNNLVVKISTVSGTKRIEVYPNNDNNDPSYIIDHHDLDSSESLSISTNNGDFTTADDFTISFSGKPPAEVMTCAPMECNQSLALRLYLTSDSTVDRTVQIQNTYPQDRPTRYFSISILD